MKVTLNWLKDYVDFDLSVEDLSHRLTMAGLEVDALERLGDGLDSVIVARLVDVQPHPEADRLTVCTVDTGSDTRQVVCGATNHKTGDLVALAQVGSVLPGDFKIKKSRIRGMESQGMLCSESELGFSEESAGIMILPSGLTLGQPYFEAAGLKDIVFELGLTPNRPDCLSVLGVAREISAMTGNKLRLPEILVEESATEVSSRSSVKIDDPDLCPRYAARLIEGVRIGPSPDWLVRRVEAVGMRSINNVVDVTNFVMMELGQPLHAFDFNRLREQRIVVRRADQGEEFTTLDGQVRLLQTEDLVICDGVGPVALAGIMGGQNSEVEADTTDILLESAYFNPVAIRRTSKRLGLHTESSHRFERGADVDMVPFALDRAAALIAELANGQLASGVLDVYPEPIAERILDLSVARCGQLLGVDVSAEQIGDVLAGIGLHVDSGADRVGGLLKTRVPNFRPDIEREIDLIEEVARLIGYDKIPVTMPASRLECQRLPRHLVLERAVRDLMISDGFAEIVNYSFVSAASLERVGFGADDARRRHVVVLNPLSEDQAIMRTSLVAGLLETAAGNLAYRNEDLALFELRPVFSPVDNEELPRESLRLTALMCGRREPEGWAQSADACDFYDMKGCVEHLLDSLRVEDVRWDASHSDSFYHPGKSAALYSGKLMLGTVGELHPAMAQDFDLNRAVMLCDLDLEAVFSKAGEMPGFVPLSRYPDIERDSAFLIDEEIPAQRVLDVLNRVKLKDLESIVLFDVYSGKGIPDGKKSLAIRARYRALDRTLTDEFIQKLHGKLIKSLQKEFAAELR
jgi:phenylalanyl-tRNA synthetase beta chain